MTNNLPPTNLYEQDFYAWTQQQAECLRSGHWEQLDIENLVEEIESMGKREKRYLEDHLGILIGHLLQWHYQPQPLPERSNLHRLCRRRITNRAQNRCTPRLNSRNLPLLGVWDS